ncbi:MAG: NAD-dependent epimerase/dehydratase family protein [Clostridiales bacterium]|nr:NAD-dependent epimerase/dehydratase family protein [Clostridiales bacterium]
MKKILITGANSYVGTSVEQWLRKWPDEYRIDTLDMKENKWENFSFSGYDVVYHVAGIAHVPTNHETDELYYSINRDLAIETAKKAKAEGVKQFIFMSSGILYGIDEPVGKKVMINKETIPHPLNAYGISKLEADNALQKMANSEFKVVCMRPPMIYGKNCKGNFQLLNKYADKLFLLPKIENRRSMIHIENLASFVKTRIDAEDGGVFWPQNADYISTNNIVEEIRRQHGKKTHYSKFLGIAVKYMSRITPMLRKIYGDLAYDQEISAREYIVNDFTASIKKSI